MYTKMVIVRRVILVIFFLSFFCGFIIGDIRSQNSVPLGRLVFTDYSHLDNYYQSSIFDLSEGRRYSLDPINFDDITGLWKVDENTLLIADCFVLSNPFDCSASFRGIILREELSRFTVVNQQWRENFGSPIWSPNKFLIAFSVSNSINNNPILQPGIYIMNSDGTGLRSILQDSNTMAPVISWSLNSEEIAFPCDNNLSLCLASIDNESVDRVFTTRHREIRDVIWSTTDFQITFTLRDNDYTNSELAVLNVADRSITYILQTDEGIYLDPIWSPDGLKIAAQLLKGFENTSTIVTVNVDSRQFYELPENFTNFAFGATWSPNSEYFAFFAYQDREQGCSIGLYTASVISFDVQYITDNCMGEIDDAPLPVVFWIP